MRKKLMLRLCLVLMVALTAYSCRTDQFPEKETYNNSSKFQLTSKRISLDEAKHKSILFPEIEKAEADLKNTKANVNGRLIDYGNGVSIDTDQVIYIENGPNFHTYTFKIKRENAPETAPLENLLLMPTADGSYKEFLVTYNLTAQEREKVKNGEPVNTKGKTTITELANGTFNSGGQLAKSTMVCGWSNSVQWARCSEGIHSESTYGSCQFVGDFVDNAGNPGFPPYPYLVTTYSCVEEVDETFMPTDPGSGGGGGVAGGDNPDQCTTVANNPGEVGIIDENGCHVGGATQPNDPDPDGEKTSCQILKENSADPVFQGKLDSLKKRTMIDKDTAETVINVKKAGANLVYNVSVKKTDIGFANTTSVEGEVSRYDIAGMHNHPPKHLPIFSFDDIVSFYSAYKFVDIRRKPVYTFYVTSENGTTYALRMNDISALDTLFAGLNLGEAASNSEEMKEARNRMKKIFDENGEDKYLYDQIRAEKLFMNVLNDARLGSSNGMHIYRKDSNGWGKLKMDANGNVTKENCPL